MLLTDLAEDERVEDQTGELVLLINPDCLVGGAEAEDLVTGKVEDESDNDLVESLTEDHHPHLSRDERRSLAVGLALEYLGGGGIGSEGKSGEGVHDEVDPEKLNGGKNRLLIFRRDGGNVGDDDGGDVDGELELSKGESQWRAKSEGAPEGAHLKELLNRVVDAASPHDGRDDASEVVVHKNDIGSLLGDLGSSNTHSVRERVSSALRSER